LLAGASWEAGFLATKADRFIAQKARDGEEGAGAKQEEKASAFSARNDSWVVEERSE